MNYGRSMQAGIGAAQTTGADAEREYLTRAKAFDPYAAAETSAQGQFRSFQAKLAEQLKRLRSDQVGMGRIDTGFATEDEDRVIGAGLEDLNSRVMANANHAASMDLANTQQLGGYGERKTDQAYGLMAGERDRQTAERNARRQSRGDLFGALAGAAGTVLAGPLGGAAAKGGASLLKRFF